MAIRPIMTLSLSEVGNRESILRKKSDPVELSDDASAIIQDLKDTLQGSEIAVGLSAVQIGYPKRIFILNLKKGKIDSGEVFINPVLSCPQGEIKTAKESCMSILNVRGDVARPDVVKIEYLNESGERKEKTVRGFEARVIQHEMDHLDGVLFTDRVDAISAIESVEFFFKENYPLQATKSKPLASDKEGKKME